jgi:AAA domain
MTSNYYCLLMAQSSLRPLRDKFYESEGFYTGIGYAFPAKNENFLKQIVSALPNAKIVKMPIGTGQTFDSIRHAYKAAHFRDKLADTDNQILSLRASHSLQEFSEECIRSSNAQDDTKKLLLELLHEKETLNKAIDWAEGIEKAITMQKSPSQEIKFICENEINFLMEEAPQSPRLINYMDNNIPKPFIRKGIVGMLVGAGGVGKTHALAQLAISIATGTDWLGKFPIEQPGYVFMGLGENAADDIHRLLRKIVIGLSKKDLNHTFFDKDPFLEAGKRLAVMSFTGSDATFVHQGHPTAFFEDFLSQLKSKEPEEGWSCIILDPISRFLGADAETDNAAATRFISLLERMTLELKGSPTVLFGHHMNKSGVGSKTTDQSAARGSSALTDGVRWQANLERVRKMENGQESDSYEINQISLKTVKSNFTAILPEQRLQKDETGCLRSTEKVLVNKEQKGKFR